MVQLGTLLGKLAMMRGRILRRDELAWEKEQFVAALIVRAAGNCWNGLAPGYDAGAVLGPMAAFASWPCRARPTF
jgi:hypothetical protein